LDEANLYNPKIWQRLTGSTLGAPVAAESLAKAVIHPEGLAKGRPEKADCILYLNQADRPERVTAAEQIIRILSNAPEGQPDRILYGCLLPKAVIHRLF